MTVEKEKIVELGKIKRVAAHYIKSIFFSVLAFALLLSNFFLENSAISTNASAETDRSFQEFNYEGENLIEELSIVRFPSPKIHNLDSVVDVNYLGDSSYIFELNQAHFWANFSVSSLKANFVVEDVVLIPNRAAFELFFDGNKFELEVYEGDVYLGLLPEGVGWR